MIEFLPPTKIPKRQAKGPAEPVAVHNLFLVNSKNIIQPIAERECRIIVTGKITWAEPIIPLKGAARKQKRFMIGAFAFYTRKQAERKKLLELVKMSRLQHVRNLHDQAWRAGALIKKYNETGVIE